MYTSCIHCCTVSKTSWIVYCHECSVVTRCTGIICSTSIASGHISQKALLSIGVSTVLLSFILLFHKKYFFQKNTCLQCFVSAILLTNY